MLLSLILVALAAVARAQPCGGEGDADDWLLTPCTTPSTLTTSPPASPTSFVLSNGVVARTLEVEPTSGLLFTASVRTMARSGSEKLSGAAAPEAALEVNGVPALVGGNVSSASAAAAGLLRFVFTGQWRTSAPTAGGFVFTPGSRGSRAAKPWPPKGLRAEFDHAAPCSAFAAGEGSSSVVTATIIYELFDSTSAFAKRVALTHNCSAPLFVFNMSVSLLPLKADGLADVTTDASISEGALGTFDGAFTWVNRFVPIAADHSHDADLPAFGPGLSFFAAGDEFTSYMAVETFHDAARPASGTLPRGMTRFGLESSRMWRTLAPQTEQFPLTGNAMCTGPGDGLAPNDPARNSWCYDSAGTQGLNDYLGQAHAVGWEMVDISLNMNSTWRSLVGVEFQSAANVSWFRALVDRAKSLSLELGAYQLLRNARSATAINQCAPDDAASLPNAGFDDMDLLPPAGTGLPCHNGGSESCRGGPGCCSTCAASEWFVDELIPSVLAFWDATGMTVTEQDGAESNSLCANASHAHHRGLNDSVWRKWERVHDVFRGYLSRGGWVQGMPGHWLEGGQAKVPGGYDEMTWSLPRWTWLHRQRERIIADPQDRDRFEPNALRYFCAPFTPYHPVQVLPEDPAQWAPVYGLESTATLEPLEEHVLELEWALSQSFGTGVFVNFRGPRIFGGPLSQAAVNKWTAWFKRYRTVLVTDFVTVANGTVCWGAGATQPDSTCTVTGVDAVLHRAPAGFYPDIEERALLVVWNGANATQASVELSLPLYYAGLAAGAQVSVRREENPSSLLKLDANSTLALPAFTMEPLSITFWVIEAS